MGIVIGMDEVGRGPWAGPVVACAFTVLHPQFAIPVADSKTLSAKQRQFILPALEEARAAGHCAWSIASVEVDEIDRINILQASMLAMRRAAMQLAEAFPEVAEAWIDGNRAPPLPWPARTLIGGDGLRPDIGAASIIAKIWRDALMARLHESYPHYGWNRNAGYGTAAHAAALAQYGPTPHHRRSFRPVREVIQRAAEAV